MQCSGRYDLRNLSLLVLGMVISGILPLAAHAADHRHHPLFFATPAEAEHAQNHPECTCRAAGQSHPLGAQICLAGGQLFRCTMDQNVTSWKPVGTPCPQS